MPSRRREKVLPREHGAYGQIAFPLIAAYAVAGVSTASLLMTVTVIAGFMAHEPAAILLVSAADASNGNSVRRQRVGSCVVSPWGSQPAWLE
jgi:hypothetical protein